MSKLNKYVLEIISVSLLGMLPAAQIGFCAAAKAYTPVEIVSMLQSDNEEAQANAIDGIRDKTGRVKSVYKTVEIKNALYDLLAKTARPTDSFDDFQFDPIPVKIMWVMGDFKETRALPYLLNNVGRRTNILISLAVMGEPTVEPMLKRLQTEDEKGAALQFFEILFSTKTPTLIRGNKIVANPYASTYTPQGAVKGKIIQALKQGLSDPNNTFIRETISVLRLVNEPKDKSLLDEAEKRDPHRMTPEKKARLEQMRKTRDERRREENERRKKQSLPSLEEEEEQRFMNYQGD